MPKPVAVPEYQDFLSVLTARLKSRGFESRRFAAGRLFEKRIAIGWHRLTLTHPPQAIEKGAVRFSVRVEAGLDVILKYHADWTRATCSSLAPPEDSAHFFTKSLFTPTQEDLWRVDSTTDAMELSRALLAVFDVDGARFLAAHDSLAGFVALLTPSLIDPEAHPRQVVALALIARSLGDVDLYEQAMRRLESYPPVVRSYVEWARSHWFMIPRYA